MLGGCILMPRVWKLKGKGGADHSLRSYDYFIKHHCAACGWSFETKSIKTFDDFKQFFSEHAGEDHKWSRQGIHSLFDQVKAGDFLWTRKEGIYYVAKVPREPRELFYFDTSREAHDYDCAPQLRNIEWKEVGTEEKVPGSISTYTGNRKSISQVDRQELETKETGYTPTALFSAMQFHEEKYFLEAANLNHSDLWFFLNYQAAEDLASLWLYDRYKYVTIPSTSKQSTQKYEFVLIDGTIHNKARSAKRIYVQVKNGNKSLDLDYYKDLLSMDNDEVWLFSTRGHININQGQKASIVCCRREKNTPSGYSIKVFKIQELLDFAFDKNVLPILPKSITTWVKYINDGARLSIC